jgi:predicted small lipoprotein YifL
VRRGSGDTRGKAKRQPHRHRAATAPLHRTRPQGLYFGHDQDVAYISIALAVAALSALPGCGNKGPLVMPQKPVPVEVQPVTPPPAEQSQHTQDAKDAQDSKKVGDQHS